ncbi:MULTISPECIES: AI-2E family transporter [Salinibaculum]|uniref:AI-2E family transporter n=1 Tax=Salinibaculum TaxID=2732368 RepID=UPI0030D49367
MDSERSFELLLLALATVLTLLLLRPFVPVVLASILLAYLLRPLYTRLEPRLGARPSAIGLIFATLVLFVIPFVLLFNVVVSGLRDLLATIRESGVTTGIDFQGLLESTFGPGFDVQTSLRDFLQDAQGADILQAVFDALGGVSSAFIRLTILLFLLYYLLKSGADLVAWVVDLAPLSPDVAETLLDRSDRLLFAVVVGNTAIAVVDGLLVGLGLLITGFTDVLFWTFLSIFLALIPLIGTTVVWIPAAIYLLLIGNTASGVFLFLYGALVVGAVDNVLRPFLGSSEVGLDPPLFIFGVFSGLVVLGFVGLYFGPVILGLTKILYDTLGKRVTRGDSSG